MKLDGLLAWVLIISTFLIGGKAIGLLNISWTVAFAPLAAIIVVSLVVFLVTFALMYKVLSNKQDNDNSSQN